MLTPEHEQFLLDSAVPEPMWGGLESLETGLQFTHTGITGKTLTQLLPQERFTNPEVSYEKKYVTEAGKGLVMPVPPGMREKVLDPDVPILICEGTKGHLAAAAVSRGVAVIGTLGCDGWGQDGGLNDEFFEIPFKNRKVYVMFDADLREKHGVHVAATTLRDLLMTVRFAKSVEFIEVPGRGDDSIDDLLARVPASERTDVLGRMVGSAVASIGKQPPKQSLLNASGTQGVAAALIRDYDIASGVDRTVYVYHNGRYHNGASRLFHRIVEPYVIGSRRSEESVRKDIHENIVTATVLSGAVIPEFQAEVLIPFRNGLLDPMTGELQQHSPEYRTTRLFDLNWDPEATCPFYEEWCERQMVPGTLDDFEETISQMFDQTRPPVKAMLEFGPSRSGKGTVTRIMEALVGKKSISAVSLHSLSDDRFSAADLYGMTLNIYADLSADEVKDLSAFKMALGDDYIRAQRKYGQPFTFRNTAMMVFAANSIPPVAEASNAYLSRMKPFHFPNSYIGAEDPSVIDRLIRELPGIAVRWVNAYRRRTERGTWLETDPRTQQLFRLASNEVEQFLDDMGWVVDPEQPLPQKTVTQQYHQWSRESAAKTMTDKVLMERLVTLGVRRWTHNGVRSLGLRTPSLKTGGPVENRGVSGDSPVSRSNTIQPSILTSSTVKVAHVGLSKTPLTTLNPLFSGRMPVSGPLSVDFETNSADKKREVGPFFIKCLGWWQPGGGGSTTDTDLMCKILGDADSLIWMNGGTFDLPVAAQWLGLTDLSEKSIDIDALYRAQHPKVRKNEKQNLDTIAKRILGETKDDTEPFLVGNRWDPIPADDPVMHEYCIRDAELTYRIHERLKDDPYYSIQQAACQITNVLNVQGVKIDVDAARDAADSRQALLREVRAEFNALYGIEYSGVSPWRSNVAKAVLTAKAEELGILEDWPKTNSGNAISTKSKLMEGIDTKGDVELREMLQLLIRANKLSADFPLDVLNNLYGDRVFPNLNDTSTNGRWRSSKPNILGAGKRSDDLLKDRRIVIPDTGLVLIGADLSGIDNRAVCGLSGDEDYLELLQPGADIHQMTANKLGITRVAAKVVNHGINYGLGAATLSKNLGSSEADAQEILDEFAVAFPLVSDWKREVREEAEQGIFLSNGHGRWVTTQAGDEYTEAPARAAASCARDLLVLSMARDPGLLSKLYLVIHDEVVLQVRPEEVDEYKDRLHDAFNWEWGSPSGLTVPILSEVYTPVATSWYGLYEEDK